MQQTKTIWQNGEFVDWDSAQVHVMAHGLHYGSSVFEGIRSYATKDGAAIFRLGKHIQRLFDSAKMYRMKVAYTMDEICDICLQVVARNELKDSYIRPIIYCGAGELGLVRTEKTPIEVAVGAMPWGPYLGEDGLKNGIDACVSSWRRMGSSSNPVIAKAGGHYLNAQLIAMEANRLGFHEGISLGPDGSLSEGSGENIFIIKDDRILTPPVTSAILEGITRDTAITLAKSLDIEVREQTLARDILYVADEIFMTGTAAEITPVRSVDGIAVGTGKPGPITKQLQQAFFGLFKGSTEDKWNWLDPVPVLAS
jgi:branched-chain amino acid aminotransferase